jgi:hypothetical protein
LTKVAIWLFAGRQPGGNRARDDASAIAIARLGPGEVIWDTVVTGFGARRQRSDAVSYVVIFRTRDGRQRWHTIGRHGAPWVPDTARDEARRLLGAVAGGDDPAAAKQASRRAVADALSVGYRLLDTAASRQ